MGDRYTWTETCPNCGQEIEVYYAESCGVTAVTCPHCGAEYDIVLKFVLQRKEEKEE